VQRPSRPLMHAPCLLAVQVNVSVDWELWSPPLKPPAGLEKYADSLQTFDRLRAKIVHEECSSKKSSAPSIPRAREWGAFSIKTCCPCCPRS
jgi:hypothetical protein